MKKNLQIFTIACFVLFFITLPTNGMIKNVDKPLKGEWDFKLQKIWEINSAGDDVLVSPKPFVISDEGTLFMCDRRSKTHYIFDKDGKFVKSFAAKGEGPGEVKDMRTEKLYIVNDKLLISDRGKIHYFKKDGTFIKSANYLALKRRPRFFLNEDEFIYAPLYRLSMPDGKGQISKYNLKTNKETPLVNFSFETPAKTSNQGELVVFALSPTMRLGYGNNKIYYGINDSYRINATDLKGKHLNTFSLIRKKEKTSIEAKKKFLKDMMDDPQQIKHWANTLPGELTYFWRIEIHNNLIYIFKPYFDIEPEKMQVDIFSPEGKYLYRSYIHPGKDLTIFSYRRLEIKKGHLYMVVEDKEGEVKIIIYKMTLPIK